MKLIQLTVVGSGGRLRPGPVSIDVRHAGTAARFLPSVCALGDGAYELDGSARMRERPIAPLLEALRELGVAIECLGGPEAFPIRVHGAGGRLRSGVAVDTSSSSQFASGLLLSAPRFERGLLLELGGAHVSRPYLGLTLHVMDAFGGTATRETPSRLRVRPGGYSAARYRVEPDASAASYFFAAAAITGGRVVVEGLGSASPQGDLAFVRVLERMGCRVRVGDAATEVVGPDQLEGVEVDMRDISDTAQTLAAVAVFARRPTRIGGIGFIRRKETDRVAAVAAELRRAGIDAIEDDDGLTIEPSPPRPARIETYGDHRMAMSFALIGLRVPGIVIADPGCVTKTYPEYFAELERLIASERRSPAPR